MPLVLPEILPGHKADAAQHDEQNQGDIHQRVGGIGRHGRTGTAVGTHQVKARVAERGDGVKYRVPQALPAHAGTKPQGQQRCSGYFHDNSGL